MRKNLFFVLAIVFFVLAIVIMGGYYFGERSRLCAPIGIATRVVVSLQNQTAPDHVITNPERIRQLTAFADARRKCSQPTTYTMPAPQITATFYNKDQFLGAIGVGQNFFFVACPNWRGIRNATDSELKEFNQLISDIKLTTKQMPGKTLPGHYDAESFTRAAASASQLRCGTTDAHGGAGSPAS